MSMPRTHEEIAQHLYEEFWWGRDHKKASGWKRETAEGRTVWLRLATLILSWREAAPREAPELRPVSERPQPGDNIAWLDCYGNPKVTTWQPVSNFRGDEKGWLLLSRAPPPTVQQEATELMKRLPMSGDNLDTLRRDQAMKLLSDIHALLQRIAAQESG